MINREKMTIEFSRTRLLTERQKITDRLDQIDRQLAVLDEQELCGESGHTFHTLFIPVGTVEVEWQVCDKCGFSQTKGD